MIQTITVDQVLKLLSETIVFSLEQFRLFQEDWSKMDTHLLQEKIKNILNASAHMPISGVAEMRSIHEMRLFLQNLENSIEENIHDLNRVPYDYVQKWGEQILFEMKTINCKVEWLYMQKATRDF